MWVSGTCAGILAGAGIPPGWTTFADRLTVLIFVILTAECAVTTRDAGIALLAGACALLLRNLPAQLGVPVAALLVSGAGTWLTQRAHVQHE
jgi:predicted branched-subunit amino acid permease